MVSQDPGVAEVASPATVALMSAGSVLATVFIVAMCTCCRKSKVPQHKAKVTMNVVAEEEMRTNTLNNKRSEVRRGRPPSMIFDGTPMTLGRWNDLTTTDETNIPETFRRLQRKPERPLNPPDVIMHPALMLALRQQAQGRPQSTIVLRTPMSPGPLRSSPTPQPSASLEDLIREHQDEEDSTRAEADLSRRPTNRDGSILYYHPKKEGVSAKPIHNLQPSRGRIWSTEDQRTEKSHRAKPRQTVPSDPGVYQGLPQFDRLSGEWDNVPKPAQKEDNLPALPLRNYLADESDSNPGLVSNISDQRTPLLDERVQKDKVVTLEQAPNVTRDQKQTRSPSPKRITQAPRWNEQQDQQTSPDSDNVFHGSENAEFVHNSPQKHNRREDCRNAPVRSDTNGYRHSGDVQDRAPYVDERQRRQRHRRANDVAQHSVSSPTYDPKHKQFTPGSYLKPKPYYFHADLQDHSKRFSDASDYSDLIYERTPHYADRVNRDYDPYFFRSRWSMTPDLPQDGVHRGRRNSDFVVDERFGYPRDQQQRRQCRKPCTAEEQLYSNVTKSVSKNAETDGRLSSGYHSFSSKNEDTSEFSNQRKAITRLTHSRSAVTSKSKQSDRPWLQTSPHYMERQKTHTDFARRCILPQQVNQRRQTRTMHQKLPSQSPPHPLDVLHEQHYNEAPSHHNINDQRLHLRDVIIEQKHHSRDGTREQHSNKRFSRHDGALKQKFQHPYETLERPTMFNPPSSLALSDHSSSSSSDKHSSDYGSLIGVLYRYRKNVRKSRKEEKPAESPESRLHFEREILRAKLKGTLEPRHLTPKHLDMVIETLLFLCETDNIAAKRSVSRERLEISRPNSAILLTPCESHSDVLSIAGSDVTRVSEDYAQIRSKSLESRMTSRTMDSMTSITDTSEISRSYRSQNSDVASTLGTKVKSTDIPRYSKINKTRKRRRHDYCEIKAPIVALADSSAKEFAFPTEEELQNILTQPRNQKLTSPPPVPLRGNESPIKVSQEKNVSTFPPHKDDILSPTSSALVSQSSPGRNILRTTSLEDRSTDIPSREEKAGARTEPVENEVAELLENAQSSSSNHPDSKTEHARIRNRLRGRRSLTSIHLTENEVKWLETSGGKVEDLGTRKKSNRFNHKRKEQKSLSAERKNSAKFATLQDTESVLPAHMDSKFADIPVNDNTDAEDIIKEIERRMSSARTKNDMEVETRKKSISDTSDQIAGTDSEMESYSSVSTKVLPNTPPRNAKFHRSGERQSIAENSPPESPDLVQHRFYPAPPDAIVDPDSPSIPLYTDSVPLVGVHPVFQTPPTSPLKYGSNPVTVSKHPFLSTNTFYPVMPSPSRSPKIEPQILGPQFTPRKQMKYPNRLASTRKMSKKPSSSAPVSPISGTKPAFSRISTKHMAKLPFIGRRFVQSTSEETPFVAIESERRRLIRGGKSIILPADGEYSEPLDCVHGNVTTVPANRDISYSRYITEKNIPHAQTVSLRSHGSKIYSPCDDFDDYAVPINSPPNVRQKQRFLSQIRRNIPQNLETAV